MMKDQILPNSLRPLSCQTQGEYPDTADVLYLQPLNKPGWNNMWHKLKFSF